MINLVKILRDQRKAGGGNRSTSLRPKDVDEILGRQLFNYGPKDDGWRGPIPAGTP